MGLTWTEWLSTGVEWQDEQHKELFGKINRLMGLIEGKSEWKDLADILRFLDIYISSHFRNEESAMYKLRYPESFSHKAQHELFKRLVANLKDRFERAEGRDIRIFASELQKLLTDWLYGHIAQEDKRLGSFLQAHGH
ncbi:MAG: hemerythrin family protein [Deltaproteobacteria bacterium]|nr:hemerythrin family protein [Deltaproteobacteria bacterium]